MSNFQFNYDVRIKRLESIFNHHELDYILISNIQNLYYLSGTAQYGLLLISKDLEIFLFIRRNFEIAKKESYLTSIFEMNKTKVLIDFLRAREKDFNKLTIGLELDSLPTSYYLYYKDLLKPAKILNIEPLLRQARMVKDKKELKIFREAGKVAQKAQEVIPSLLKEGLSENYIASEIISEAIKHESIHFSNVNNVYGKNWFIFASGENVWNPSYFPIISGYGLSKAIPYGYSSRKLKKKDIVVCDYAITYKGYHADHARTYFVSEPPEKFKERYTLFRGIYEEIKSEYLRAGIKVSDIYNKMHNLLKPYNLDKYFQGDGKYYQGLGHGIGLELDEPPAITSKNETILQENMVIALEPKIIIPGWGAINFEDDFIIKSEKPPEQITKTKYLFE